ncbi:DUF2993 domain-containing protein [Argonema galeatum]|uniref:LmeA family phospholipid-binding protein n=1 Tax=Argonema galeatum TaxID=2942762 RepID=UPI0020116CA9|nr:DUF2993 domain-containing protein [Argonema galeatum]MCL1467171.1 DUF2993 domain-containing protein [Argonema galeatum A003/A1]
MSHAPSNDDGYPERLSQEPLKQSRIISKVLTPAVRLWLRSQVEQVEDLQINIQAGDRLLLTGHIPKVSLSARRAVYQGLYVRQIQLVAETIRINLGQVLKGKSLRLLEPVPVTGELLVEEVDLNASLKGTLLPNALTEFLMTLLKAGGCQNPTELLQNRHITWEEIAIDSGKIKLSGTIISFPVVSESLWPQRGRGAEGLLSRGAEGQRGRGALEQRGRGALEQRGRGAEGQNLPLAPSPSFSSPLLSSDQNAYSRIAICTGVELASCHELRFIDPQIEVDLDLNFPSLDTFQLDLGPEVDLQQLTLSPGQLFCRGGILVRTD